MNARIQDELSTSLFNRSISRRDRRRGGVLSRLLSGVRKVEPPALARDVASEELAVLKRWCELEQTAQDTETRIMYQTLIASINRIRAHIAVQDHLTKTGKRRRTKIDGRTTRHPGYAISQVVRKRIEEIFGWIKQSAGLRQSKFRGLARVNSQFTLNLAAYNLIRLPKLLAAPP